MDADLLPLSLGFARPAALLALPAAWVWIILLRRPWRRLSAGSRRARRREGLVTGFRLLLATLIILGLAGPQAYRRVPEQAVVFLLDVSASTQGAGDKGVSWINRALAERGTGDLAGVVAFGEEARVEETPRADPSFRRPETQISRHATDAGAALGLARTLLPPGYRQRVVLITDGRDTSGRALPETRRLAAEGVRVDVVPLDPGSGPEARVTDLHLSPTAYQGERVTAAVTVESNFTQSAEILLFRDGELLSSRPLQLQPGSVRILLESPAGDSGMHVYTARLSADADTFAENNHAAAVQKVLGPPRVLIVEGTPGEGEPLARALEAAGAGVDVTSPGGMPGDMPGWLRYQSVFLANVAASDLGTPAMEQLEVYVRDMGRGLAMVGGEQSFGPGGYGDTPVERALPVHMDLRGRARQPVTGLVLVLDKSESMSVLGLGADKMAIAREAAVRATRALTKRDLVGVVAFDEAARWVTPLGPADDPEEVGRAIGGIAPEGGTRLYPALAAAYEALTDVEADLKHVIVFSDGFTPAADYVGITEDMAGAGITLSSVEVTTCAGQCHLGPASLMETLSDIGKGRFYHVEDAAAIPDIVAKEAVTATRSFIVNRRFLPAVVSAGSLAANLPEGRPLDGYVAATAKERAEVVLISPEGDPVLASWQYGLGRAVAWTSDVRGRWSGPWLAGQDFPSLWGGVLSWLLPGNDVGGLTVVADEAGNRGLVRLEVPPGSTGTDDFTARVSAPGGESREIPLKPVAPGRYESDFPAAEPGVYLVTVGYGEGLAEAGLVVPYSAEFRAMGTDQGFLEALARAGGGEVISRHADAFAANLPPVHRVTDLWPWLLGLAALLLPLEVGNRRLDLFAALAAILARARGVSLKPGAEERDDALARASLATTERLRERKAAFRGEVPPAREAAPKEPKETDSGFTARLIEAKRKREERGTL